MRRITKTEREHHIIKEAVNNIFMQGWNAAGDEATTAIERMGEMLTNAGIINNTLRELIETLFDEMWEQDWYEQGKKVIDIFESEKQEA